MHRALPVTRRFGNRNENRPRESLFPLSAAVAHAVNGPFAATETIFRRIVARRHAEHSVVLARNIRPNSSIPERRSKMSELFFAVDANITSRSRTFKTRHLKIVKPRRFAGPPLIVTQFVGVSCSFRVNIID